MDSRLIYTTELSKKIFHEVRGRRFAPFPVVATMWRRNELLVTGYARPKTHPIMSVFGHNGPYLHAEMDMLQKAIRTLSAEEIKDTTVCVARVTFDPYNRLYSPANACPCKGCHKALMKFGIPNEEVLYT